MDIYEFTSFSNRFLIWDASETVLDIYEFTSFSNSRIRSTPCFCVLDIYEFTSFSNFRVLNHRRNMFWISTNLHHSQTLLTGGDASPGFGYLRIYIILKPSMVNEIDFIVLDIYEFTSFSNRISLIINIKSVLDIYEITPFSNGFPFFGSHGAALELYEITPFSNIF